MVRFLASRLSSALLTLLAVSVVTFVALTTVPGDAAQSVAGESASRQQLTELRREMGLDQPLPARYAAFLGGLLLRADLGRSLVSGRPVAGLLAERLPFTLALAVAAICLAMLAGAATGIWAARRAGSWSDSLTMAAATLGLGIPTFWSALLLIMLFSLRLRWLPVTGAGSVAHVVLPSVVLALPVAAVVARLVRAGILETISADFVRTAHGKGLSAGQVVWRHVIRNGLIPVTTVLGLHLGHLLGGAFVVETIFAWPGLGRLAVQAIFDRDYPVVMGCTLLVAAIYLIINLAVDLIHAWMDPRVADAELGGGAVAWG